MSELPELGDIPEPVMARFKRLPFPMQMRVAADVMDAVNLCGRTWCLCGERVYTETPLTVDEHLACCNGPLTEPIGGES